MNIFVRSRAVFPNKIVAQQSIRTIAMGIPNPPRRFAPLAKGKGHDAIDGNMVLKGIVFDMDGTLCE
jgi:hypothetical protein